MRRRRNIHVHLFSLIERCPVPPLTTPPPFFYCGIIVGHTAFVAPSHSSDPGEYAYDEPRSFPEGVGCTRQGILFTPPPHAHASPSPSQNIKLAQAVFKSYLDVVGADHPFAAKNKVFNAMAVDCRRLLSSFKWFYQVTSMQKEVGKWGDVVTPRQTLKFATLSCTCVEQSCSDLQLLQDKWFRDLPKEWFAYTFTVMKFVGNVLSLVEDVTQLKAKQLYLSSGKATPEVAEALRRDIFRHRLAMVRQVADIVIYLQWADNWKRTVSARVLSTCGLVSSVIGVYEVYCPHTHRPCPASSS